MMPDIKLPRAFIQPADLIPVRTGDGSFTLDSRSLGEHYHSLFGALAESRHVYIQEGLRKVGKANMDILEVGLGTGLNALLTWEEADQKGTKVNYLALEPFPLPAALWSAMGHASAMEVPGKEEGHRRMMNAKRGEEVILSARFRFRSLPQKIQDMEAEDAFDLVYFDAFAPAIQPEMWTVEVFRKINRAMRPDALLVTYCAKGDVRRAMLEAGFSVQRRPGPAGKREILAATRLA